MLGTTLEECADIGENAEDPAHSGKALWRKWAEPWRKNKTELEEDAEKGKPGRGSSQKQWLRGVNHYGTYAESSRRWWNQSTNVKVESDRRQRERECLDIQGYDAKESGLSAGQICFRWATCCSVADGLKQGKTGGRESSQNTDTTVWWKDDEGLN